MPRSLLARLLAVSLTVATCAIVATAWLTHRTTSDHLQAQLDRVLEADASVYQELVAYAEQHPDWEGVGPLVARLSQATGRRIALTDPQGAVLADSATGPGEASPGLPDAPDALIDVLALPAVPSAPPVALAPLPAGEQPAPSDLDRERNRAYVDALAACLAEAGIAHQVHDTGGGLRAVEVDAPGSAGHATCDQEAADQARADTSAGPALLYLGTTSPLDPLAAATSGPAVATLVVVAAVTLAITALAARRLLRPVRALTSAARRMEAGDTAARVGVAGPGELATLGHAFNAMADAAQRNERARKATANDVAHELRNPLANIRGHLEAAQDGILPLDRALVDSLLEEARTLERLTDDLRDLALADAGQLPLHPEPVDLNDLADQVAAAARGRANSAGVDLVVRHGPPAPVHGDPTRLRQGLGNLLDNALRHTPAGGTTRIEVTARGVTANLAVVDSGPGIDPDDLPNLFDRFYRADPSRSRATGGSGLGLAITKHLVEAHDGQVTVRSRPGRGSTFTIVLPLDPAHSAVSRRGS